ncbi:MAG: SMP-30/gluconolactonase/LRE family protein [Microbacterium sp.]|uniref:SMP-30/gluconolactonase/LRE family protein n=1 Tax=Microbacterium sp. TaxID=51671 RepID=UPI003F8188F0
MRSRAEPVRGPVLRQAESPRWDARGDRLLWVDMGAGDLYIGHFSAGEIAVERKVHVGESVGFAAPLQNYGDGWICARERGIVHVSEAGHVRVLQEEIADAGTQFNDGACDLSGTLWAGTQSHSRVPDAALFTVESDLAVRKRLEQVTVSNGLGFTPDGTRMYYIDTLPRRALEVFDVENGELINRRTLARVEGGNPDGLAVDNENGVWVAVWDAGEVRHFDAQGSLTRVVDVAATRPTAVCLAGNTLVISTARLGLERPTPLDGGFFAIDVDVPGTPAQPWRADPQQLALLRSTDAG